MRSVRQHCFAVFVSIAYLMCSQAYAQDYQQSAMSFFTAVKNNEWLKAGAEIKILASASPAVLKEQLNTEGKAKAFWINLYNAFVQYLLNRDKGRFQDRSQFFTTQYITIAHQPLSLDDIEHGIIRHSRNKYSLGYLARFSVSDFEKKFRLRHIDYRIHFALNCGAKSCPKIALYTHDQLENQLDRSTALYLQSFASYDASDNMLLAPLLCAWYKADFGGEQGVIQMMKKNKIVPPEKDPDVEYLPYDWTLQLSNYITL